MGFPADDPTYYNPTPHRPQEDTMTANIQTIAEAGFPLQLRYIDGANCPFVLTAAGISIVGFNDRDLAARTLQDAHGLRVQTDHNGTIVVNAYSLNNPGEIIGRSDYTPFVAVEEALKVLADNGRQYPYQAINCEPEDVVDEYEEEDTRGAVVREDADGFLLTTASGEIRFTDPEDALDAAGLLVLTVSGHNRRQEA